MVLNQAINRSSATARHTVGQRWVDKVNGKEYMYVSAGATLAIGDVVSISPSTYAAALTTKALVDAQHPVAAVVCAIPSGHFGWVQIYGIAGCRLLVNCVQNLSLYSTATAGALDDEPTSQTRVRGVFLLATITTAGVYNCFLSYPAA